MIDHFTMQTSSTTTFRGQESKTQANIWKFIMDKAILSTYLYTIHHLECFTICVLTVHFTTNYIYIALHDFMKGSSPKKIQFFFKVTVAVSSFQRHGRSCSYVRTFPRKVRMLQS